MMNVLTDDKLNGLRDVFRGGRRPIDYVQAVRMEHARHRIETGRGPIDDVGFQVGYEDPAFFRRLFKRTTGVTPTAYRRRFEPIATGLPVSAHTGRYPRNGTSSPD